jgi:hypothetical protein
MPFGFIAPQRLLNYLVFRIFTLSVPMVIPEAQLATGKFSK